LAIRVHILAKEINVTGKAILDKCKAEGLDVKNHMTVLNADLEARIRKWFCGNVAESLNRIEEAARTHATEMNLNSMELTELPPEILKLTHLTKLNLRKNQLMALSPEIGNLTDLTSLDLGENQLTNLPSEIGKLTNLTSLDLGGNQLMNLPPEIWNLTNLTFLNIGGNKLTALPPEIGKLTNLNSLYFMNSPLTVLPSEIGNLTNLTSLYLINIPLTVLPSEIWNLTNLTSLFLMNIPLTVLPSEIGNLTNLTSLYLMNNQLTALPPEIMKLTNLTSLGLSENQLAALPPKIGELVNLNTLVLSENQLTALPPEIGELANLTTLVLSENQLTALPPEIGKLTQLKELYLHGNLGLNIPPEILGPTWVNVVTEEAKPAFPHAILDYYFRTQVAARPLNEAKMILVGRGEVGKTSLVRRLRGKSFNSKQGKTQGIQIDQWPLTIGKREKILLRIWDFGGQEIMHATHQFFLTKRSLYLVVLNGREGGEDLDAEYWLKTISTFAPDSPVLIVLNKFRQHAFDLNRRALQGKYLNIQDFIETDCASPKPLGIAKLKAAIKTAVDQHLPELRTKFPANWASIKNDLATMKGNYLTFDRYREICVKHKETDSIAQELLAGHLHDLGIALNYKDDPRLCDKHVLNPHWVTNGIYTILNAPKLATAKGALDVSTLTSILDPKAYPREMHTFLLELMRKFELCFTFSDQPDRYLIPELLGKNEASEADQYKDIHVVQFRYKYDILPEGLIPRFIVRTYIHSENQPRWRTGVILKFEGNQALVRADIHDGCIHISVLGPTDSRRRLLAIIRSQFDHINRSLKLTPQALVPVPNVPGLVIPYDNLVAYEGARVYKPPIPFGGMVHEIDILALLDGIDIEGARSTMNTPETKPLRLFYSYSSKDEEFKLELETHLTLLKRQGKLDTWNMRMIPPGKEWEKVIDENLKIADIIVLLVSADFIASDYCYDIEMKFAMQQHEKKKATVIPIIVRDCDRSEVPFAKLQALPKGAKPIKLWPDRDSAWKDVAETLRKHLESMRPSRGA
jgi:internalin A